MQDLSINKRAVEVFTLSVASRIPILRYISQLRVFLLWKKRNVLKNEFKRSLF